MRTEIMVVGLGGFCGSICRYLVYLWFGSRNLTAFPWATLAINISGCFTVGILSAVLERSVPHHRQIFLLGSMGFLGAFTTFSAFGLETFNLLRGDQVMFGAANIALNVIFGIFAVWAGRSVVALAL